MLIAKTTDGKIILGLDDNNIDLLKKGQPILKALARFGGHDDIIIMYGPTLDDIKAELKNVFGALPPPSKLPEPH